MTDPTPLDLDALEPLLSLHGLPWHVAPCKPDCPGSVVCTALRSVDGKKVAPEKVRAFAMLAQELLPALLDELRRLRAAGEWIPCSTRMPELSERVWFVAQDGMGLVRKGEFNGDRFVTATGFSWEPGEVTHWMHRPLEPSRPSPPVVRT